MISVLEILLRLTIWFLLTADGSLANIIIGLAIALLLPRSTIRPKAIKEWIRDWLHVIWEIIVAIPQAYFEAIEIMFRPHLYEDVVLERVKPNRTPGLIFLDIFLITFTPKTIVLNYRDDGWYTVHRIRRRPRRVKAAQSQENAVKGTQDHEHRASGDGNSPAHSHL
ncbi:MAG: Na+/H+ antiporter subunit E [Cyanobacteria bacterium P01_F01_bin.150]